MYYSQFLTNSFALQLSSRFGIKETPAFAVWNHASQMYYTPNTTVSFSDIKTLQDYLDNVLAGKVEGSRLGGWMGLINVRV